MNAEDLDLIREKILLLCRAANLQGLRPDRILRTIQRCGWEADEATVARELRHLQSAGFLEPAQAASFSPAPALTAYVTTAAGDHELERRGLL